MHAALLAVLLSTVLSADTPLKTQGGATFVAPAGWRVQASEFLTIVSPPEPGSDSGIMLVDMHADDAEMAAAVAWTMYARVFSRGDRKIKIKNVLPDKDGWTDIHQTIYITSPNEKRTVTSVTRRAGKIWTVVILDMDDAVLEKRGAQVALITGSLLPKGYTRESFAGKKAHKLDAKRIAALSAFVENGQKKLGVPGVSVGIVQDGKVIFEGGFGVRDIASKAKPDGNTLYMIASNSKALTTLMLAKLVDEKKMTWETPVSTLLPSFKLGTADTTSRVLVKHLICACTGLPRQDYEWLFQYDGVTSAGALQTLSTVQPTSKFGEMYQYSNLLAGAAGFVGGHVLYPDRELGAAYDEAMRTRVFTPLGMTATTFDYARALASPNHATAHAPDVDGKPAHAVMEANYSIIPLRPAGGAWSSVHDMLKYVQMELDEGKLPDGTRYVGKEPLLARRAPQVAMSKDQTYGMGLMVDTKYGIPVVHHGGDMIGYHSDMIWLPEQNVGAVILTNSDPGWVLRTMFRRKLLEVLFDGRAEADADVAAQAKSFFDDLAAERKLATVPAVDTDKLASHYRNAALGDLTVRRSGAATLFDFGEWKSEVASRHNPDGTVSFLTTVPGMMGFEFVVGAGEKRSLIVRDAQHEYVFTEQ